MSGETLADWLALHGLDRAGCAALLAVPLPDPAPGPGPGAAAPSGPVTPPDPVTPETLWRICFDAFARAFPQGADVIARAADRTLVDFRAGVRASDRALTLAHPDTGVPVVICPWRGRARDAVTLAHEAAHAVQLVASDGTFMAPAWRETCAMLGEYALAAHLVRGAAGENPDRAGLAGLAAWILPALATEQARRTGALQTRLVQALDDPGRAYDYAWNYPLAQHAAALWQAGTAPRWPAFTGALPPGAGGP